MAKEFDFTENSFGIYEVIKSVLDLFQGYLASSGCIEGGTDEAVRAVSCFQEGRVC